MEPTMSVSTERKMEPITIQAMGMHATPMDNALLDQSILPMDLTIQPMDLFIQQMDLFIRQMDHMPTL